MTQKEKVKYIKTSMSRRTQINEKFLLRIIKQKYLEKENCNHMFTYDALLH